MNVVSTSPSATEILYALGVEPVAVSHACDYPPEVENKPRIDSSRIEGGTSGERHEQTETAAADGHVYSVHAERLRAAEPDLIVTQEVCGVCAVDTTAVDGVLSDIDVDPEVIALDASRLEDLFECIQLVGRATGRQERAADVVAELRTRLESIETTASQATSTPTAVVIEWMDPIHVAGNWVPELIDLAGGAYGLAEPGQGSRETEWTTITEYAPEVLIVNPCSYPVDRTRERLPELAERDGWHSLPAVRNGRVYALDGSSYLTRWAPRLVDGAERLATVLHPDLFGEPPSDVARLGQPPRA